MSDDNGGGRGGGGGGMLFEWVLDENAAQDGPPDGSDGGNGNGDTTAKDLGDVSLATLARQAKLQNASAVRAADARATVDHATRERNALRAKLATSLGISAASVGSVELPGAPPPPSSLTAVDPADAAAAAAAAVANPTDPAATTPGGTLAGAPILPKDTLQAIENLLPTAPEYRTWKWSDFFFLWMSMSFSISTWMLGASLLASGLRWWESVLCILSAHVAATIPVLLSGHVGTKWGIAFPYWCRVAFGTHLARLITLFRGLVACTLMGQQMWMATNAVYTACAALLPGLNNAPQIGSFGTDVGRFFMYIAVALVHMVMVYLGMNWIRRMQKFIAPLVLLFVFGIFIYFGARVGGKDMFAVTSSPEFLAASREATSSNYLIGIPQDRNSVAGNFFARGTTVLGLWSSIILNISDFTRFARSQRAQLIGQGLGFPFFSTLFVLMAMGITGGGYLVYGKVLWDPTALFNEFAGPLVFFFNILVAFSLLATNMLAMVSATNDLQNIAPSKLNFRKGGLLVVTIATVMVPWKVIETQQNTQVHSLFANVNFYWSLLGAILGVMMTDYYIIRRRKIQLADIYDDSKQSIYYYTCGVHVGAVLSVIGGIVPSLPGYLADLGLVGELSVTADARRLNDFAWLVSLLLSSVLYVIFWVLTARLCRRVAFDHQQFIDGDDKAGALPDSGAPEQDPIAQLNSIGVDQSVPTQMNAGGPPRTPSANGANGAEAPGSAAPATAPGDDDDTLSALPPAPTLPLSSRLAVVHDAAPAAGGGAADPDDPFGGGGGGRPGNPFRSSSGSGSAAIPLGGDDGGSSVSSNAGKRGWRADRGGGGGAGGGDQSSPTAAEFGFKSV